MIPVREESPEVLYAAVDVVRLIWPDLEELKALALKNPRKRVRICTHRSQEDLLHEMFIVHTKHTAIPVHKHLDRAESFTVLHGRADLILLHDDGKKRETISLGEPKSGLPFYYRISEPIFHTLNIHSEFLIFYEATTGPFKNSGTVFMKPEN